MKNRGFSLIELLVALAIMSMTLLISSLGYSFFMERWQKNLGKFDTSANVAKKLLLTKRAISGVAPYIIKNADSSSTIYFEGDENGFVTITRRSFFHSDSPSVIRFSIIQSVDFSYSLIYQDYSLENNPLTNYQQSINFQRQVVLLTGMSDINFNYLGYSDQNSRANNGPQNWWKTFNAINRKLLPESIRITFVLNGIEEYLEFPIGQVDTRTMALFDEVL